VTGRVVVCVLVCMHACFRTMLRATTSHLIAYGV